MDERMGRLEQKVDDIKDDVSEIKEAIKHLNDSFAAKWTESVLKAMGAAMVMGLTGGFFYWFFMNVVK